MKEQIKSYACINFTGICITSVDVDQNFVTQHKEKKVSKSIQLDSILFI